MTNTPDPSAPSNGYPAWSADGAVQPGADAYPGQEASAAYQQPDYTQPGYAQSGYSQSGYAQPGYAQPMAPSAYPAAAYPAVAPIYGQKSTLAAGLLGIFLGALGVHNFYLGYVGKGVAQLLISILSFGVLVWVSAIWGLIEGILHLTAQPGVVPWGVDARGVPLSK